MEEGKLTAAQGTTLIGNQTIVIESLRVQRTELLATITELTQREQVLRAELTQIKKDDMRKEARSLEVIKK